MPIKINSTISLGKVDDDTEVLSNFNRLWKFQFQTLTAGDSRLLIHYTAKTIPKFSSKFRELSEKFDSNYLTGKSLSKSVIDCVLP